MNVAVPIPRRDGWFERMCIAAIGCCISQAAPAPVAFPDDALSIKGDLGSFRAEWRYEHPQAGVTLATLTIASPQPAVPPPLEIAWKFPAVDLAGTWTCDIGKSHLDHQGTNVESRAVLRAPLLMFLGPDDGNRFMVACSDTLRPLKISGGVVEEDLNIHASVKLFAGKQVPLKDYSITFRFDTRTEPYYVVLGDTARWWAAQEGYHPAPVPEVALTPLYSTWYSYHQSLNPDTIVEECRLGGEIGLGGVIVDDGWQTLDSSRGYAFTGDWKPERIPDFKGFVDRIHALKQKFILWYSVPLVGENSLAVKRFEGKLLYYNAGLKAHVLDPRYPDVREYLIGLYEKAVNEWGVDGLKLDFIELFAPKPETVMTAENGRDYASVDEAVDRFFTDVMKRLRAIKPDIAIEFRQPYNGPLMRKYGNMLRGVDCPNAGPVNRKEIVDLRLLADNTAVHSDMIAWHANEPVPSAALQILNVIYSVPQISVRLGEVSPAHRKMIGFWMTYWKENRGVLLDGNFQPVGPAHNFPLLVARTGEKLIATVYQDMMVAVAADAPSRIDVINAKPGTAVVLRFGKDYGPCTVRILDCMGGLVREQKPTITAGVRDWEVPPSGLLEIRREK